jgi:putative ABC transport system permease protein
MIKNYLKIAWRNLLKHKTFSLINILGLAIGIASCMIIFIYVQHELTFDQYNKNADRIARISGTLHAPESDVAMATSPALLASVVKKDYPEIEATVRLEKATQTIRKNDDYFREEDFYKTEQSVFSVFSFDAAEGSLNGALENPNSIVITSGIAKKYFGNEPAVGKIMVCNGEDRLVTAVIKNRPANSDLKIDGLVSNDFSKITEWMDGFSLYTFVLFNRTPDFKNFEKKLADLSKKYVQAELDKVGAANYKAEFFVEPLRDVHFVQGKHEDTPKGNRQYNYVFSILAVFILVIALLNYINLSTAKATERAKEVGIRKVSGALPLQLIRQFLFESLLLITIASLISIVLVSAGIPLLNKLLQTNLNVNWEYTLIFTGTIFLLTLLLAGLYPAFVLSAFKPVKVLKGSFKNTGNGLVLRKTVTVVQFAIAAALIMGTTVIYNQLHYIENKNLGFNKEHLMNIYLPRDSAYQGSVIAFVNAIRQRSEVQDITVGGGNVIAGLTIGTTFAEDKGKRREVMCNYFPVDPHFLSVFKVELLAGRNLSDSFTTDKNEGFLVNEAFVKMMGWQSAIGKQMEGWGHKGKVVGIVKNFYYRSLHNLIEPLILVYNTVPANIASVKIDPKYLPVIKDTYKQYFPAIPIDYSFFDEILNKQYHKDKMTMSLFNDFTVLAIFISCLGLYGLVSLIAIQRAKEIGIRKVLGASLSQLLAVLSKEFIQLICVALLIALPVAGYLMSKWLNSYAYHTTLNWWMFFMPALAILFVALAVISREVIRTAMANPVKNLRTE